MLVALALMSAALVGGAPPAAAQFAQQGNKLVGSGAVGNAGQGISVALSGDGGTAIVGGDGDDSSAGAAWVFTRGNGVWTQQRKLVGSGATGAGGLGKSVALSADGNTALVGGSRDNGFAGAAWVFIRYFNKITHTIVWSQQGNKLVGSGATGKATQGNAVAISADGNTAIVGGPSDNGNVGAAWIFTRSTNGTWTQQGARLVGVGQGASHEGFSVALSADGNTAILGGPEDDSGAGAAWVFVRASNGTWSQQGTELVGAGAAGYAKQGWSVALSADGNTAIVGGIGDHNGLGAVWIFTRSNGVWRQQGDKLVGSGTTRASQGVSVALSADGDTAVVGGSEDLPSGATWVFTRSNGVWSQQGEKLVGSGAAEPAYQGIVALSDDATTAIVGGSGDNGYAGAAWVFVRPSAADITSTNDFNNDGRSDVLWRHTGGDVAIWEMKGTTATAQVDLGHSDTAWQIAGTASLVQSTGDFDGDHRSDILWRSSGGDVAIWEMEGTTPKAQVDLGPVDTAWQIAGVGDFDGDGKADILWRHSGGDVAIWLMNGTTPTSTAVVGSIDTAWQIVGIGDFDGDGKADILWHKSDGSLAIWLMNGITPKAQVAIGTVDTSWQVAGVGDFDGDGMADILWQGAAALSGSVAMWEMNGVTPKTQAVVGTVDSGWQIVSTGDYDGDGKADILWRHTGGDVAIWEMNGTAPKAQAVVGTVDTAWTIVE